MQENHFVGLGQMMGAPFNVVIAYEDSVTGKRAKALFDRLARGLDPSVNLVLKLWKFSVLESASLRELAISDAADAAVVVVAAANDGELPAGIKTWMRRGLAMGREGGRALVALLYRTGLSFDDCGSIYSYLAELAAQSGMDFFAQTADLSSEELDEPTEQLRESIRNSVAVSPAWFLPRTSNRHSVHTNQNFARDSRLEVPVTADAGDNWRGVHGGTNE